MPIYAPVPVVADGDTFPTVYWNHYIAANFNKLLQQQHRRLTVAQFSALTSPEDGDEVYLEVDATNGIEWHLVFDSAEATYGWRYVGGPMFEATVATSESTSSTTYVALTTPGPTVALPRAGDYDVDVSAEINGGGNIGARVSYDIGVTGAVDADSLLGANGTSHFIRTKRKAALATSSLVSKYRVNSGAGSSSFANRRLAVRPVRIRHDA